MSRYYPCIYYDRQDGMLIGRCKYYSKDGVQSWCAEGAEDCEHETPSNADRIRAMSDEELAEFICGVYDDDNCGVYQGEHGKFINGTIIFDYDEDKIAEWLKQPAEE